MMKYILIIGGILIAFLNDIFEKEKDENSNNIFGLKKITKIGWFILCIGIFVSSLGVYQTYTEEKETEQKNLSKSLKDSLTLVAKNKSDSTRFMTIIESLSKTQKDVVTKANDIVTITKSQSEKQLIENNKNRYLIPEKASISFESNIILDKENLDILEKDLVAYLTNNKGYDIGLKGLPTSPSIGIDGDEWKESKNKNLATLCGLKNGIIGILVEFKDSKNNVIASIVPPNHFTTSIQNWRMRESEYENIIIDYTIKNKLVSLKGFRINMDFDRTNLAKTLFDLEKAKLNILISFKPMNLLKENARKIKIELKSFSISTNDGLSLSLKQFTKKEKKSSINYFEANTSMEHWK
jgi:hypothetical protein